MNVSLDNDLIDFVRWKVERGRFPSEEAVLQEAVRRFRREDQDRGHSDTRPVCPALIDDEAIAYCAHDVEGKDVPSIEEVRRSLSRIRGSMSQAVIEQRQD
jgi:Arc/MetJ-type ribon-helix-helix transcriptional regulator